MKWMVMLVILLGLCGCNNQPLPFPRADQDASGKLPNTIGGPVDADADALPCAEQPCEPDDAGRCMRCPLLDGGTTD